MHADGTVAEKVRGDKRQFILSRGEVQNVRLDRFDLREEDHTRSIVTTHTYCSLRRKLLGHAVII